MDGKTPIAFFASKLGFFSPSHFYPILLTIINEYHEKDIISK